MNTFGFFAYFSFMPRKERIRKRAIAGINCIFQRKCYRQTEVKVILMTNWQILIYSQRVPGMFYCLFFNFTLLQLDRHTICRNYSLSICPLSVCAPAWWKRNWKTSEAACSSVYFLTQVLIQIPDEQGHFNGRRRISFVWNMSNVYLSFISSLLQPLFLFSHCTCLGSTAAIS